MCCRRKDIILVECLWREARADVAQRVRFVPRSTAAVVDVLRAMNSAVFALDCSIPNACKVRFGACAATATMWNAGPMICVPAKLFGSHASLAERRCSVLFFKINFAANVSRAAINNADSTSPKASRSMGDAAQVCAQESVSKVE